MSEAGVDTTKVVNCTTTIEGETYTGQELRVVMLQRNAAYAGLHIVQELLASWLASDEEPAEGALSEINEVVEGVLLLWKDPSKH